MRWFLAGALLVMLGSCGASEEAQCKEVAGAACRKLFECWTKEEDRTRLMLGANVEECITTSFARCSPPEMLCEAPKRWDGAEASRCFTELSTIKCTEVRVGVTPTACSNTCR
jgi:hypothetical protein